MVKYIEINQLDDPDLAVYAHLNENQLKHYYEPYGGLFIGESPNVILRALDAGYEPVSLLMEEKYVRTEGAEILRRLEQMGHSAEDAIPVYLSTLDVLSRITGYHLTRGILCAFRRKVLPSVEDICVGKGYTGAKEAALRYKIKANDPGLDDDLKREPGSQDRLEKGLEGRRRIAVLENIENPTNVGAIFRSAAALGIDGVLLTPACADPLYRRAIRVSVGTVFQIPWTYIGQPELHYTWMKENKCQRQNMIPRKQEKTSPIEMQTEQHPYMVNSGREAYETDCPAWPDQGMKQLHELGFRTAAMALRDNTVSIADPGLHSVEKLAIILGNEGEGLLPSTIAMSDYTIRIPMSHGVDSLNVAAASAVAFWELGKNDDIQGRTH